MAKIRSLWRWARAQDPLVKDGALALLLTASFVAADLASRRPRPSPYHLSLEVVLLLLALTAPVTLRRRWPLPAFCLQFAGLLVTLSTLPNLAFGAPDLPLQGALGPVAIMIGAYSAGAYSASRRLSLGAVAAGTALIFVTNLGDNGWSSLLLPLMWFVGHAVRAHRLYIAGLRDRARYLERERQAAVRAAAAEERARIARELHDVVAHSVSVMVVQAEAAGSLLQRRPERAAEAIAAVAENGRQALAELRHLLGLLGDGGQASALVPQPGLADVGELLERMRAAGLPVELRVEGRRHDLPAGLDVTAYRIIQEALTNALRHAGPTRTEVVLRYGQHEMGLDVLDDGDAAPGTQPRMHGAGRGLIGMRERVAVYGGELDAGPRPGHGYAVRARLPLDVAAEPAEVAG